VAFYGAQALLVGRGGLVEAVVGVDNYDTSRASTGRMEHFLVKWALTTLN
jgi:hypothetical protein